jgi:undecaprenyl pyrophosphate phosphatase UppP
MRPERMEMSRPPRGWLKGVLVTIFVFWYSGVTWEAFTSHQISEVRLAGSIVMIGGLCVIAHQALTNDDYRTSKATRVANYIFFVGLVTSLAGAHLN